MLTLRNTSHEPHDRVDGRTGVAETADGREAGRPVNGRAERPVGPEPSRGEAGAHALAGVDRAPATVGIRGLARDVSGTVAGVARSGRGVLITKHGRPHAAIVPVRSDRDMMLSSLSTYLVDVVAEDFRARPTQSGGDVAAAVAHLADAVVQLAAALAQATPPTEP